MLARVADAKMRSVMNQHVFKMLKYDVLLTGQWPHYDYEGARRKLIRAIRKGRRQPFIDPRYRNRSTIEAGLVRIMEQCWEFDYHKRVSVFEVRRQLYALKKTTTTDAVPAI